MDRNLREFSYRNICRNDIAFLAFLWCISFISGMLLCSHSNAPFYALMCSAAYAPVSIVGLVCVMLVPLSASVVAAYYHNKVLILLISSLRGIQFGYCLFGILLAFDSCRLLIAGLLMFSSAAFHVVLLRFWIRFLCDRICLRKDVSMCGAIAVAIGSLDYYCISPFLQTLIHKL